MLATVKKLGGSVAIVIPKGMAADNQLSPGTAVDLSQGEDGIVIRRSRRRVRRPMNDMLREIDPAAYSRVSVTKWRSTAPSGRKSGE